MHKRYNPNQIIKQHKKSVAAIWKETREALLYNQNRMCAICGTYIDKRTAHLDHDHETGKLRGVLCMKCNVGLGMFGDSCLNLDKAIQYITTSLSKNTRKVIP